MTARRFVIPLTAVAIALGGAYLSLPWWAPPILRWALPPALTLDRLTLKRPDWHALTIGRIGLTYTTGAWRVHAEGTDVKLQFHWLDLLRGRLDTLRAATLQLSAEPQTPTPMPPATEPNNTVMPTPAELLTALPVGRIDLPAITLQTPAPQRIRAWSGAAHLTAGRLTLALASATVPRLDLSLRADRDNRVELLLQRDGQAVATLHNHIEAPRTLRGSLALQLAPLAALAQEWGLTGRGALPSAMTLTGTVSLNWSGALPDKLNANSWRSLALRGSVTANASGRRNGTSATLAARADYALKQGTLALTFKTLTANGTITAPKAALALVKPQSPLPFSGRLAPGAVLKLAPEPLRAALQGTATVLLGTPNSDKPMPLRATMTIDNPEFTAGDSGPRLSAHFALEAQLAEWRQTPYRLRQLNTKLRGELEGSLQQGMLQLSDSAQWSVHSIRGPDLVVAPLRARTNGPLTLHWQSHALQIADAQLRLDASSIRQAGQSYRLRGASADARNVRLDLANPLAASGRASLQLDGLSAPAGPYRTQPLAVHADLQLAQAVLRGRWTLSTPVAGLALNGNLHHNLKSGSGGANATLPAFAFRDDGRYLPALLERWPYPFDLSGGKLGLDARLAWGRALRGAIDIDAQALAGFYNLNVFKGLNTQATLTYASGILSMPSTQVTLAELNVGFPVRQLRCDVSARLPDTFRIGDLRAELLGGTLQQPELRYRRGESEMRTTWQFTGLHLDELVGLEQNIEGSGVLDGQLPIAISAAGIAVTAGEFRARAPGGVIRYRGELPQSTLASIPALQLTLDSLRNFHYRTLDVRTDYAPTGQLDLGIGLFGRNPDLDEPRPVQFNLTVHENIPELLRSLQLSSDIGDKIERRVQDFYRRHQQEMPQ